MSHLGLYVYILLMSSHGKGHLGIYKSFIITTKSEIIGKNDLKNHPYSRLFCMQSKRQMLILKPSSQSEPSNSNCEGPLSICVFTLNLSTKVAQSQWASSRRLGSS